MAQTSLRKARTHGRTQVINSTINNYNKKWRDIPPFFITFAPVFRELYKGVLWKIEGDKRR
jgi:hypothetical protein